MGMIACVRDVDDLSVEVVRAMVDVPIWRGEAERFG